MALSFPDLLTSSETYVRVEIEKGANSDFSGSGLAAMKEIEGLRLCLSCQTAIKRNWVESVAEAVLHIFVQIDTVRRTRAVIIAATGTASIAARSR